jgi:hypothetical protein
MKGEEMNLLSEDSPNTYITEKMMALLGDSLSLKRYAAEYVKADNLRRLQRQLRKGSWVSKCVEWQGVYNTNKGGTMRIIRVKRLNLPGDETCKT